MASIWRGEGVRDSNGKMQIFLTFDYGRCSVTSRIDGPTMCLSCLALTTSFASEAGAGAGAVGCTTPILARANLMCAILIAERGDLVFAFLDESIIQSFGCTFPMMDQPN